MNCPRCCLPAEESGEARIIPATGTKCANVDEGKASERFAVYQCPRCVVRSDLCGIEVDLAYTFAVNAAGELLDGRRLLDLGDAFPGRG